MHKEFTPMTLEEFTKKYGTETVSLALRKLARIAPSEAAIFEAMANELTDMLREELGAMGQADDTIDQLFAGGDGTLGPCPFEKCANPRCEELRIDGDELEALLSDLPCKACSAIGSGEACHDCSEYAGRSSEVHLQSGGSIHA